MFQYIALLITEIPREQEIGIQPSNFLFYFYKFTHGRQYTKHINELSTFPNERLPLQVIQSGSKKGGCTSLAKCFLIDMVSY